jgi:hypothetical protein
MCPRSQERHRNREATVYLPALGGAGLGLVVAPGRQHHLAGNGADFPLVLKLETS